MTLLISVASSNYALSTSDMRISIASGGRYSPVDEAFNKHIFFNISGLKANITYTGLAQWNVAGKTIKMYDVITESLVECAKQKMDFGPLAISLVEDISKALQAAQLKDSKQRLIELHIIGYHEDFPYPLMACILNNNAKSPWKLPSEFQWNHKVNNFNIHIKMANSPDIMLGGMTNSLERHEVELIIKALNSGGNAFNLSNLASKLIERASNKSSAVGSRPVTTLMPTEGFLDVNLWDNEERGIVGYMPRMVFPNGNVWGPSEFPVNLELIMNGHIPAENIFFRSIVYQLVKRTTRRRMFRNKKGDKVPGLMGLMGLTIYGSVPEGYTDMGLSH